MQFSLRRFMLSIASFAASVAIAAFASRNAESSSLIIILAPFYGAFAGLAFGIIFGRPLRSALLGSALTVGVWLVGPLIWETVEDVYEVLVHRIGIAAIVLVLMVLIAVWASEKRPHE